MQGRFNMIVYKNFLRVVWTKKVMLVIYSMVFLLVSMLFPSGSNDRVAEFSEPVLKIIVIDNDNSELSKNLIQYLKTKHNVTEYNSLSEKNDAEIMSQIKKEISLGNINAGIVIQKDMEEKMNHGTECVISFKDDRTQNAFYLDAQIQKFLLFAESIKKHENKFDFEKLHNVLSETISVHQINSKTTGGISSWFKYFFNVFAWFSFSLVLNLVGWVIFLLQRPTIKIRNSVSPVSSIRFAIENFAAQLTVVFCILAGIIGAAVAFQWKGISGVPIGVYAFNCSVYVAVVLSITFMLNEVFKKDSILGIVGNVLPLALSFISGVFMPAEFISPSILRIAKFFPTYYFVQANESTYELSKIDWKNIGMLLFFLLLYFIVGIFLTMRNRSQRSIEIINA